MKSTIKIFEQFIQRDENFYGETKFDEAKIKYK